MNIFSYGKIMFWRGLHFDWANYVAACLMLRGRDKHTDFPRLLFLVGMIDDLPSDARAFVWPLLKLKVFIADKEGF